jgi:hypothetical protein
MCVQLRDRCNAEKLQQRRIPIPRHSFMNSVLGDLSKEMELTLGTKSPLMSQWPCVVGDDYYRISAAIFSNVFLQLALSQPLR